jgi:hypothetical protein
VCSSPIREKRIKPTTFANERSGFELLQSKLVQLHVPTERVLIGLEATSRDARKPLPVSGKPGLPVVSAASQTNPSVLPTTRLARENRSVGRYYHCTCTLERRGSPRLCADGSDCDKRANWSACIPTSAMKSHATKTRSRRCSACSSQSSARSSLIRVVLLPLPCSNAIRVRRREPQRALRQLLPPSSR